MSASAKGTVEEPGINVKAKSGLNRSILDQGWCEFFRQLDYKLAKKGGRLIRVEAKNTSRQCLRCEHACAENRTTQSLFKCIGCGFEANADLVGAINVFKRGLTYFRKRRAGHSVLRWDRKISPVSL